MTLLGQLVAENARQKKKEETAAGREARYAKIQADAAARTAAASKVKAAGKTAASSSSSSTKVGKSSSSSSPKKKSTSKSVSKSSIKSSPPPPVDPLTEAAAVTLQAAVRALLARRARKRQVVMKVEMEELRAAAWKAQVDFERKEEAKRRKKAEEEAKRRKEEAALKKALLEAAFDGEDGDLGALLAKAEGVLKDAADTCDAHGNSLLSEAAAGGHAATISLLLQRGANPNLQGEFKRTPLWRAAFMGKSEAIRPLLEGGADPRIPNEQGECPAHVAADSSIKELLAGWDLAVTDKLVQEWSRRAEAAASSRVKAAEKALRSAQEEVDACQARFEAAQKALRCARQELEKRIFEHDTCVEERKSEELVKVTLDQIHVQEEVVEKARRQASSASEALDVARLSLRESQQNCDDAANGGEGGEEALPGVLVDITELDDVLVRDVGGRVAASGRWPLVIDPSNRASVFLRYMDTNYVNLLSPHAVQPNRLRRSLLGSLRYGKPLVMDLCECDVLWRDVDSIFDAIQPGLITKILNKSILEPAVYQTLIREEDGEDYDPNKFQDDRLKRFNVVVHTSVAKPVAALLEALYVLRVKLK